MPGLADCMGPPGTTASQVTFPGRGADELARVRPLADGTIKDVCDYFWYSPVGCLERPVRKDAPAGCGVRAGETGRRRSGSTLRRVMAAKQRLSVPSSCA